MRFFVTFWIGVVLGLTGLISTFPKAGEPTIYFMLFSPIGVPIIGGLIYFLKIASGFHEDDHYLTIGERIGRTVGVMLALFLGVPIGMLFAMLLSMGG